MNQDYQRKQSHSFDQHFQSVLLTTEHHGIQQILENQKKSFKLVEIISFLGHLTYQYCGNFLRKD